MSSLWRSEIRQKELTDCQSQDKSELPEPQTERLRQSRRSAFFCQLYVNRILFPQYKCNRQISRRIKRPPSQCTGNEMAVGIFIIVLEFYIPVVRSPGGEIPPRPHPSGSAPARCSEAKPGSGRDPGHSPLRFQSDCRSQRWTERGGVLANSQFFRPITKGLMLRSARLLESSSLPSSR